MGIVGILMHSSKDEIEGDEELAASSGSGVSRGRRYSPVVAHDNDRAVLEMSSIDPRSSSSTQDHKYSLSFLPS